MSDDPTQSEPVPGSGETEPDPTLVQPATDAGPPPEPTRVQPATDAGPTPGEPLTEEERSRRRWRTAAGVLAALLVALVAVLLFAVLADDDEDDVAVDTATTVADDTSSTEPTTTEAPTTEATEAPATTDEAPVTTATTQPSPTTIAPERCTGTAGAPDDPEPVARTFVDAWLVGDRDCASAIASDDAVDTMFDRDPEGAQPTFTGCSQEELPDPHMDCVFTLDGDEAHLRMSFGAIDGWRVFEVEITSS